VGVNFYDSLPHGYRVCTGDEAYVLAMTWMLRTYVRNMPRGVVPCQFVFEKSDRYTKPARRRFHRITDDASAFGEPRSLVRGMVEDAPLFSDRRRDIPLQAADWYANALGKHFAWEQGRTERDSAVHLVKDGDVVFAPYLDQRNMVSAIETLQREGWLYCA
jgi:hypothetical protein